LKCSTIQSPATTFTLTSGTGHHGVPVGGTVTCSGMVATFTPTSNLAPNTSFTARIEDSVEDVGLQQLWSDYVWSFKTGSSLAPPTVTVVSPLNNATGVGVNTEITATFDQPMDPTTLNSSTFKLTGSGLTFGGKITYDAVNYIATFAPYGNLIPLTTYTATITTGTGLESNFVWTFRTGAVPDLVKPTVILTNPGTSATSVPLNQIITATFSKPMNSATITYTNFNVGVGPTFNLGPYIPGTVTYAAVGNMAIFTPSSPLSEDTTYNAHIWARVTDLEGNSMLAGYYWTFMTGTLPLTTPPTVVSTNPTVSGTVCVNGTINATFSEAMNPLTINTSTFTVENTTTSTPVTGIVTLDITGTIATFTPTSPTSPLTSGDTYQATITTGVSDVLGNYMLADYVWSFTASGTCIAAQSLASAGLFGIGAYAGETNQGINTMINGDMWTTLYSSAVTGFHDDTVLPYIQFTHGCIYTETTLNVGEVTGEIYTAPGTSIPSVALGCPNEGTGPAGTPGTTFYIATKAAADALTAYNTLAGLPTTGPDPGAAFSDNLGGLTVPPGVYASSSGTYGISGSPLTLDAGGNANAVWVFQMASSLTVGDGGCDSVNLIHGAQAKNVFWQVGSAATINSAGGCTMVGTIIAQAGVTISNPPNATHEPPAFPLTVLDGRAISLGASVTVVQTVVNVPLP